MTLPEYWQCRWSVQSPRWAAGVPGEPRDHGRKWGTGRKCCEVEIAKNLDEALVKLNTMKFS
eukprot:1026036-Prorocentrum_minimum.AAC.2